ncbi:hypothetical protein [Paraburkholderia tropica]|uniref:hypothetical protein n=1 Tax=Paraburkholderia tropica TaxID=92647 RepID=UPI002AB7C574|nr:hypothetical protein [Paraburkholderia tropica]
MNKKTMPKPAQPGDVLLVEHPTEFVSSVGTAVQYTPDGKTADDTIRELIGRRSALETKKSIIVDEYHSAAQDQAYTAWVKRTRDAISE